MKYISSLFLLLSASLLLAACGFHLRGHGAAVTLAFQSVYLKSPQETPFVSNLRTALIRNKVEVSNSADKATITLEIISESTNKQILSLSSAGKVLEYQLSFRVSLSAYDEQLNVWLPEEQILLTRTLAYNDAHVLAKEQEETLLYKNMQIDAVQQALRRLSRARPHNEIGEIISSASGVIATSGVAAISGITATSGVAVDK